MTKTMQKIMDSLNEQKSSKALVSEPIEFATGKREMAAAERLAEMGLVTLSVSFKYSYTVRLKEDKENLEEDGRYMNDSSEGRIR